MFTFPVLTLFLAATVHASPLKNELTRELSDKFHSPIEVPPTSSRIQRSIPDYLLNARLPPGISAQDLADAEPVFGSIQNSSILSKRDSLHTWQASIQPKSLLVTQVNTPGTHDSASWSPNIIDVPFVFTQEISIVDQLDTGIRYLDLRVGFVKVDGTDSLGMFHGSYNLNAAFSTILSGIYSWMATHPTEYIFISVSQNGPDSTQGRSVAGEVDSYIKSNSNRWHNWDWAVSGPPRISDVAGKLILCRRFGWTASTSIYPTFDSTRPIGVYMNGWLDNSAAFSMPYSTASGTNYTVVQDLYKPASTFGGSAALNNKWSAFSSHIDLATGTRWIVNLYLNFASFTDMTNLETPLALAERMNPKVRDLLKVERSPGGATNPNNKRAGIVILDKCNFPSNLIESVIYAFEGRGD